MAGFKRFNQVLAKFERDSLELGERTELLIVLTIPECMASCGQGLAIDKRCHKYQFA